MEMLGIVTVLSLGLSTVNKESVSSPINIHPYIVIEKDDRNIIKDTTISPYQSIVKIKTFFEDNYIECTGSVISKNTVLTAAHCVYSGQKETPENINIIPAQNNEKKPFGTYTTNVFHIPSKYKQDFDYNYDIALINVNSLYNNKMIGENVQPLRIKKLKDYKGMDIKTIGYPTDKEAQFGVTQWQHSGQSINQFENKFGYQLDTASGQSGAPILDSYNQIIGVHTTGNTEKNINYATQINKEIYKWIKHTNK
ncbi:hypothetical protein CW676_11280 [Macrococcoides caseolyticum]|nr:hypothetical protein CW718_11000 [Macrococcus caseolyticus]PKE52077.1 hypothetical protein CW676_11280 [Macrococcus caseolyticus]PKE73541.1 hypothetical protein CW670_11475 [Macrococcus caseolyticus]PKF05302.1 hypothetical protein CW698_10615 [Macrococcus caseolyticus]PKF20395.1 hypothetical protein CW684_11025 [Macrococcus caseolyticus]